MHAPFGRSKTCGSRPVTASKEHISGRHSRAQLGGAGESSSSTLPRIAPGRRPATVTGRFFARTEKLRAGCSRNENEPVCTGPSMQCEGWSMRFARWHGDTAGSKLEYEAVTGDGPVARDTSGQDRSAWRGPGGDSCRARSEGFLFFFGTGQPRGLHSGRIETDRNAAGTAMAEKVCDDLFEKTQPSAAYCLLMSGLLVRRPPMKCFAAVAAVPHGVGGDRQHLIHPMKNGSRRGCVPVHRHGRRKAS